MAQQPNFMDVDIGHQRSMSKEAAMRELEDMNQASNPLQFQGECFWWLRQLVFACVSHLDRCEQIYKTVLAPMK